MRHNARLIAGSVTVLVLMAGAAEAQDVQIAVFGGYRFGGDLFERAVETPLDIDGGPVLGASLDVFVGNGQSVSFSYSHQEARADVPFSSGLLRTTFSVDHWQVGGAQEVNLGVVRPFYGAGLGLTRFGTSADSEVRFSFGGGGGAKLMPSRHIGLRVEGRVYGIVVNGHLVAACVDGLCSSRVHAYVSWQIEFTAGVVIAF